MKLTGELTKLSIQSNDEGLAQYSLKLGDERVTLNDKLEQKVSLKFLGQINCVNCHIPIKKIL